VLAQLLPSGIAPEGFVTIPGRGLMVSANEADLAEDGAARSHVMIYELGAGDPVYPHLTSAGADTLIGWGAISGKVAGEFFAVNDSFYGYQPRIFTIDTSAAPARITAALDITRGGRPAQKLDIEGITLDGEGGLLAGIRRAQRPADRPRALPCRCPGPHPAGSRDSRRTGHGGNAVRVRGHHEGG